jgi:hypothetical protein
METSVVNVARFNEMEAYVCRMRHASLLAYQRHDD